MISARKIYKIPEFYIIIARKIFFSRILGGHVPPPPPSPMPMLQCIDRDRKSHSYMFTLMFRFFVSNGRSQKFVLGGIKFFGGIKLLNSRSDVIFTP